MNQLVTVKALTETTATVAGYGVIFGGADLEGDTFTKSTNYMLDWSTLTLHTGSRQKASTAKTRPTWRMSTLKRSIGTCPKSLKPSPSNSATRSARHRHTSL